MPFTSFVKNRDINTFCMKRRHDENNLFNTRNYIAFDLNCCYSRLRSREIKTVENSPCYSAVTQLSNGVKTFEIGPYFWSYSNTYKNVKNKSFLFISTENGSLYKREIFTFCSPCYPLKESLYFCGLPMSSIPANSDGPFFFIT